MKNLFLIPILFLCGNLFAESPSFQQTTNIVTGIAPTLSVSNSSTASYATTAGTVLNPQPGIRLYNATLWGATESCRGANGASISSGSSTVTCSGANFTSADTNKIMLVTGAGTNGLDLVATITNIISSSQVRLNLNAQTSVTNPIEWGFDDTVAIQAAWNWVCTNGSGGLIVVTGECVIAGSLIDPSPTNQPDINFDGSVCGTHKNAQIITPDLPYFNNYFPVSVGFIGNNAPMIPISATQNNPNFLFGGSRLVSFLSTTNGGAMLNTMNLTTPTFMFNPIHFIAKTVNFRCAPNGNLTCLNLRYADGISLNQVYIDKGWQLYSVPTNSMLHCGGTLYNGYGLLTPPGENSGWNNLQNVGICGFYNGFSLGEHIISSGTLNTWSCYNALVLDEGGHPSILERLDAEACNTYITGNSNSAKQPNNVFSIICFTTENHFTNDWSWPATLTTNMLSSEIVGIMNVSEFNPNSSPDGYLLPVDPNGKISINYYGGGNGSLGDSLRRITQLPSLTVGDGSASATAINSPSSVPGYGFFWRDGGRSLAYAVNGAAFFQFGVNGNIGLSSAQDLAWSSGTFDSQPFDVTFSRLAPGVLQVGTGNFNNANGTIAGNFQGGAGGVTNIHTTYTTNASYTISGSSVAALTALGIVVVTNNIVTTRTP